MRRIVLLASIAALILPAATAQTAVSDAELHASPIATDVGVVAPGGSINRTFELTYAYAQGSASTEPTNVTVDAEVPERWILEEIAPASKQVPVSPDGGSETWSVRVQIRAPRDVLAGVPQEVEVEATAEQNGNVVGARTEVSTRLAGAYEGTIDADAYRAEPEDDDIARYRIDVVNRANGRTVVEAEAGSDAPDRISIMPLMLAMEPAAGARELPEERITVKFAEDHDGPFSVHLRHRPIGRAAPADGGSPDRTTVVLGSSAGARLPPVPWIPVALAAVAAGGGYLVGRRSGTVHEVVVTSKDP